MILEGLVLDVYYQFSLLEKKLKQELVDVDLVEKEHVLFHPNVVQIYKKKTENQMGHWSSIMKTNLLLIVWSFESRRSSVTGIETIGLFLDMTLLTDEVDADDWIELCPE